MRTVCRPSITIAIAMSAIIASACGGSKGNDALPTAPTTPVTSAPPPSGSTSGATIAGTVVGGFGTASFRTTAVSMVVTVVGTSIAATVDGAGRFTLRNVPPGRVQLQFSASGADARLDLDDVAEREEIHIEVRVNGATVEVEQNEREKPDQRAEVEGRVTSVSATGLMVGDKNILVPAGTVIRHGGTPMKLTDIHVGDAVGDQVEVKGTRQTDGSILATRVEVEKRVEQQEVELKGVVAAKTTTCPSISFNVGTTKVMTNSATEFRDATCAALAVGDQVEVKGTRQTDGSVLATRVKVEKRVEQQEVEMKGSVAAPKTGTCPSISFNVGTQKVSTSSATEFRDTTCAALAVGNQVEVKGTRQTDGSVLATRVKAEKNEDEDKNEVELKGSLGAPKTGTCPSISFNVGTQKVSTNSATEFRDTTCAALAVGDQVEVKGAKQSDGSVLARRVEKKK
jgi:GH24 family phage-related lysozyme (muramidase)